MRKCFAGDIYSCSKYLIALEVTAQGCGIKSLQWGFRRVLEASVDVCQPELFAGFESSCGWLDEIFPLSFTFLSFSFSCPFFLEVGEMGKVVVRASEGGVRAAASEILSFT